MAILLGLLGLALLFGPSISAVVLSVRMRTARRRIDDLETELERVRHQLELRTGYLRREVETLKGGAGLGPPDETTHPADPSLDDTAPRATDRVAAVRRAAPTVESEVDRHLVASEETASDHEPPDAVPSDRAGTSDEEPELEAPMPPVVPPVPTETEPPKRPAIDWEHWVGVRGAAVLGGIVLAFAALLLLKLSIERGLIPPPVRVLIGYLAGIAALVAGQWLRPRGYAATANALAGSGTVILYGATWAGHRLFGLFGGPVAWGMMALVTVAACLLAWRTRSKVVAGLGLVGGFASPLLLGAGFEHPIGLFGYLLLLDLGLLLLARSQGWRRFGTVCLGLTALYQAAWILDTLDAGDSVWLVLLVLGATALLFAGVLEGFRRRSGVSIGSRDAALGILLPFCFVLYLASRSDLGTHLAPLALLMALLSAAALWLAPRLGPPWAPAAAGLAAAAVVWVWLTETPLDETLAWEMAAVAIGLGALFHLGLEAWRRRGRELAPATAWAAPLTTAALLAATIPYGSELPAHPAAWWCVWLGLGGLLVRQSVLLSDGRPMLAGAFGAGLALVVQLDSAGRYSEFPLVPAFLAVAFLAATGLQWFASRLGGGPLAAPAQRAALLFAALFGLTLAGDATGFMPPTVFFPVWLLFAVLANLAITRLADGRLYCGSLALFAFGFWTWTFFDGSRPDWPGFELLALGVGSFAVLLFTAWPFLTRQVFSEDRWAWYGSALAGPLYFLPLADLWERRFGDAAIGVLPVLLGGVSLFATLYGRREEVGDRAQRRRNLVWYSAVALCFVTVAIPLQVEKEWVTLGWALNGWGLIQLWRRLDHPGLKYLGLGLLTVVSVRLVANPEVLGYHVGDGLPILNWLLYTYLIPAATLVLSARTLYPLEAERRRSWEPGQGSTRAWGAVGCGLAAILVVFAWINLTIVDAFSEGGRLVLSWEREPARDLTLSLAWAIYALALLGLGLRRRSSALRWLSLVFLLLTIAKVFLHDLGALEDLYRVASLVGLAFSLIVVSLCYQRFVFRERRP